MLEKFIHILTQPTESQSKNSLKQGNIKKSIALVIKKYSFECAKLAGDKSELIKRIYTLLMTTSLEFAAKDVLGTALEHLLNADEGTIRYKSVGYR